jgi:hypothetical protein
LPTGGASWDRSLVEKTKQNDDKNDIYGGLILGFMVVFFLVSPYNSWFNVSMVCFYEV